ncbi:unnamed protein product [Cuscuta campestris]|uniref:Uncharacterized protein n=1 Tax=Cuscuta campestris TaxID=132261 RepID=A0A484L7G7_9ASTE|nr:unnamed protein product [Cuscuta campestris]
MAKATTKTNYNLTPATTLARQNLRSFLHYSDPAILDDHHESSGDTSPLYSSSSSTTAPSSPWSELASPYTKSPWLHLPPAPCSGGTFRHVATLVRDEGHVYSLAACGDLVYTGSDSRNIRVWDGGFREVSGFKSKSGFVKAIVVLEGVVFTGHHDGKIRVWRSSGRTGSHYRRVGSLPTVTQYLKNSINPKAYVAVRRRRSVPWVRHYDAVSCMSVDLSRGLLYSGSWDKTIKVWRLKDWKCVESIDAHNDAVNSVAVGFDGFVFSGSADGTVKAWRRELVGTAARHVAVETLLDQESAVTSLAVSSDAVYAGSSDGLVRFWWRRREDEFLEYGGALRGHRLAVLCLAAGAGGLVVSGSADKSICVWRRSEFGGVHVCVTVLTGHDGPVKCLAAVEEGGGRWRVYSGSLDRSVRVWVLTENSPER